MNMYQTEHDHSPDRRSAVRASDETSAHEAPEVHRVVRADELHEISLALWVAMLRAHSNLRWLERESPDVEAARRSAANLVENLDQLGKLIGRL
ncbi:MULTISPECIES: hypothetical protein [unclassified Sinorhizobium]|uniref:hypothetical protein n=1 Tax=unclassified Sinorhizobium TaxID=2613772 RepID=UPI00352468BB